jgi:hypothetical protein
MSAVRRALIVSLPLFAAAPAASADDLAHLFERPAAMVRDARLNRIATLGTFAPQVQATASANVVAVTQNGSGNTVFLDVRQQNLGTVAAGAALNGRLRLD